MGDFDTSNFAQRKSNLHLAQWKPLRCGDYRVGSTIAAKHPVEWVERTVITANPTRGMLGGLESVKIVAICWFPLSHLV